MAIEFVNFERKALGNSPWIKAWRVEGQVAFSQSNQQRTMWSLSTDGDDAGRIPASRNVSRSAGV